MPQTSSTSPLLPRPSSLANPFNVWALAIFWGFQFIWIGLHVLLLTADFISSDSIQVFLVYVFPSRSHLINAVGLPFLPYPGFL